MSQTPPEITRKLQTLAQIATDLQGGEHFTITRLTLLKSFCADEQTGAKFALHIANLTQKKMKPAKSAKHQRYRRLIANAVRAMTRHLEKPTKQTEEGLWDLFNKAKESQNRYERQRWGAVRIIESMELLTVETAMECVLRPWASSDLGYRLARQYAERFDSRFGSGLVPKSAPMVEEIAEFWGRHYLGRAWRKKVGV